MKSKIPLPTSAEITRRLQIVSELRDLCLSLGRAKRVPAETSAPQTPANPPRSSADTK